MLFSVVSWRYSTIAVFYCYLEVKYLLLSPVAFAMLCLAINIDENILDIIVTRETILLQNTQTGGKQVLGEAL